MPRKTKVQKYHDVLRPLMSYVHDGAVYNESHQFTQDELLAVTPTILLQYLKIKIYGNVNANPDVDPPINHRANSVLYIKKAVSYFMVNKTMPWNEVTLQGNPTRCNELHQLIRSMRRMETAHRGVPSQARRALEPTEYHNYIEVACGLSNPEHAAFISAYSCFQYNMIARLDDTAKWRHPDLNPLPEYPDYGVTVKLCWSKNCLEERDAPTQVLFGAMDWRYCPLNLVGTWLELHFTLNPEENEFFFGVGGANNPDSIKTTASSLLSAVLEHEDFTRLGNGGIGSHSFRKFAVTVARRLALSKDNVDDRARWRGGTRQQDAYNEITNSYVDARVAAALCRGGAVIYFIKAESGITNQWILEYVVPHLREKIPEQAALVFGRAVLWRVFDAGSAPVPPQISNRVMTAYQGLGDRNTLAEGDNPVRKAPLGVAGIDAELILEEILVGGDGGGGGGGGGGGDARVMHGMQREEVRLLSSQVMHLRRELADAHAEQVRRDTILRSSLTRMNNNIARLAATPGRRRVGGGQGQMEASQGLAAALPVAAEQSSRRLVAALSTRPKSLHDLWNEWENGTAGKKAAKDFTQSERGKVKSQYNMRLQFWSKCEDMVRRGMTPQVACDRIYAAYGQRTSVTQILKYMRRDKKKDANGRSMWPPLLQPVDL